jgi:hypothetical protein
MSRPHGRRTVPFLCAAACACACASIVTGCSAVTALAETHRAERALVSTQGLRSTPAATYSLTMSRAYLEKAREESAEAHYGRAVAYARAATGAAQEAQRTQVERITSGMTPAPRNARASGASQSGSRPSTRGEGSR